LNREPQRRTTAELQHRCDAPTPGLDPTDLRAQAFDGGGKHLPPHSSTTSRSLRLGLAGAQGSDDNLIVLAALPDRPCAGILRHFVGRGVDDGSIVPEDVLCAISVMDVEVEDCDGARQSR
jgi:hypothetical protein